MTVPTTACAIAVAGPVDARVAAPTSKSVTNRMLVAAALAAGDSALADPLHSDDSLAMVRAVEALGAQVTRGRDAWQVRGSAGRLRAPVAAIDASLSGTTMRFATALATLAPAPVRITGAPALLRRPVGPLVDALSALGAQVASTDGFPPVQAAGGGLDGGATRVDATRSSQFASALLLVAPYARADVTVRVAGAGARAYIALTAAVMRAWGAEVEEIAADTWRVTAGRGYAAGVHRVEYDASAAAHLLAVAVATAGRVTVTNPAADTVQPDADLTEVFAAMGATVDRRDGVLTVIGPDRPVPVDVDLTAMPDQVATVATLAALADGTSTIRGVAVARLHETDRLAALGRELPKLGITVDQQPGGLRIHGGRPAGPAQLDSHDDHRLAMAFAVLGARVPGVVVSQPWCVTKTYPEFWRDLRGLGVDWRPEPRR